MLMHRKQFVNSTRLQKLSGCEMVKYILMIQKHKDFYLSNILKNFLLNYFAIEIHWKWFYDKNPLK